jgi:transposase
MAGKRIEPMDIKQLITLKQQGVSNRKCAQILKISRNTVNDYASLFERLGYSFQDLLVMDNATLKALAAPQSEVSQERYEQLASYFDYFLSELKKPGCTLLALWHQYREKHPDGYGYTQFTHHFNLWNHQHECSTKLTHKAAEKLFIDYTGKKLTFVDRQSGEVQEVEVFVAILPCSQYTYVEATPNQQLEELIASTRRAMEFFGGAAQAIVPDNLKSAVTRSSRYEPTINKTFKDFALHYGCVVDPARPYSPQDKAMVEGAVKLVYQRIFYPLSKSTFFSLAELNAAIRELLVKYNNYLFKLSQYSRKELFVSTERPYLTPLPPSAYQVRQYRRAKVQKMGFVYHSEDKHYYSVPYRYIGKDVEVQYTESVVEIFYHQERIATHKRNPKIGAYSVQENHLSSAHKSYSEWSLTYFQQKAKRIGPFTESYITKLILQYKYPELGYKQAMGVIHLHRGYSSARVEKACERCLAREHITFTMVQDMLQSGMDQLDLGSPERNHIPTHTNIRGANYYQ